jgi:DNA (cytosine-5)-methyltransferase 1
MAKIVSLFSGAGGLDAGFKLSGGRHVTALANEILPAPAETFSINFQSKILRTFNIEELELTCAGRLDGEKDSITQEAGHTPGATVSRCIPVALNTDVQNIDFEAVLRAVGHPDVVLGGPPCQDFSVLRGKDGRKGIEVSRGRLYSYFVKGISHLNPEVFVFENVPGLISANGGLAYRTIVSDFENLDKGYEVIKKVVGNNLGPEVGKYKLAFNDVVDFSSLGVPQKRKRLIIIGVRKDTADRLEFQIIKEEVEEELRGRALLFSNFPLTPIEVFEGDTLNNLGEKYKAVMEEYEGVWKDNKSEIATKWKEEVWDHLTFDAVEDYLFFNQKKNGYLKGLEKYENAEDFRADTSKGSFWRAMQERKEVLKLLRYYGKPVPPAEEGGSDKTAERMRLIPPGGNFKFVENTEFRVKGLMSNIYRRLNPLVPSPAVIAYGGGGTWGYHYRRGRSMLTNQERARLQTFQEWFRFAGSNQEIRAQIGEAVPPLGAYHIARAVQLILKDSAE